MKKELFFEYADWLGEVFEKAEHLIDVSTYDTYQKGVFRFIGEILTNVYVAYAKASYQIRVKQLSVVERSYERPLVSTVQLINDVKSRIKNKQESVNLPQVIQNDDINVVLAIDDNYAPHAAVTIISALKTANNPSRLHFYIMHADGFSESSKSKLTILVHKYSAQIDFLFVDKRSLLWLPLNREHISLATYYRLVIDVVLPKNIQRVIYLDADTLVLAPIENLWEFNLEGQPIGGCADEVGKLHSQRLRLPYSHTYFNAGVLLLDLKKIRQISLKKEVQLIFRKYGRLITLQDQDILNILFCNRVNMLPLNWNAGGRLYQSNRLEPSYSQSEAREAAQNPFIVHFTTAKIKPWNYKSLNPFAKLYWDFRDLTPWRDMFWKRFRRVWLMRVRTRVISKERQFRKRIINKGNSQGNFVSGLKRK